MALYDLVHLKHQLASAMQVQAVNQQLDKLRTDIANVKLNVENLSQENENYINDLLDRFGIIKDRINEAADDYEHQIRLIDNQINEITNRLFFGNYELETRIGDVEFSRNSRRINIDEELEQVIKQRILLHTNWRYPALEIGCRDGEWTQYLVAADPLYIVDRFPEFIDSTAGRFTPEYQRRLRQYHLTNHDLTMLPVAQMAFVFSWGYFNYVSLDTMKQYLKQIWDLLRPGGIFLFSYNDGDTPTGASMAERFAQTYMPKSLLVALCDSMGYQVDTSVSDNYGTHINWIEIKKPGQLSTVKAHQVLGEILKINL